MKSKQEVIQIISNYANLTSRAQLLLREIPYLDDDQKKASVSWIGYEEIGFEWEAYWNYGGHDEGSFVLPTALLWDENLLIELKLNFEKEQQLKLQEKQDKIQQAKELEMKKEKEQLKKLLEKYGEESK